MEHDRIVVFCATCGTDQTMTEVSIELKATNGYFKCYCCHCNCPLPLSIRE